MSQCANRISRIHLLVEGELRANDAADLRAHIGGCASCSDQFDKFQRMKRLLEDALAAKVEYHDSEEAFLRKMAAVDSIPAQKSKKIRFARAFLLLAAASLAAVFIGVYLLAHYYFHKTFSFQLSEVVTRCSGEIERVMPDSSAYKLRAGDRLEKGMRLETSPEVNSFISFDRLRLLSNGAAILEIEGSRSFTLREGEAHVASVQAEKPLEVSLGRASFTSDGGSFRIKRVGSEASVGVAEGSVEVTGPDGKRYTLTPNQVGAISEGAFLVKSAKVDDPFELRKVTVIDRIKERFAKILSKYPTKYMLSRSRDLWPLPQMRDPMSMLQFAAYKRRIADSGIRIAQRSNSIDDYYESLFSPSNRTLSLGRQRLIPIRNGKAASLPIWSHDGSMIAYNEYAVPFVPSVVRVARLDDLDNPWTISQESDMSRPMFPVAWTPDNRHVLFQDQTELIGPLAPGKFGMKIAPIDPGEGPLREFKDPFPGMPFQPAIPVFGTICPCIVSLPWGDALLCSNGGNIAYIPIEPDGSPTPGSTGLHLTNFNPREMYVVGVYWSPSADKIIFMGVSNISITLLDYEKINVYILYDVDDILDGFTLPPRSIDDARIKHISPSPHSQYPGGFSFDESLVFFQEDVSGLWEGAVPTDFSKSDFDLFYANALPGQPSKPMQIQLPGNQMYVRPSPEGNRLAFCNYDGDETELRVISFGVEADMDMDLGGVIIDNSGTNLIVPPGALEQNFKVSMSTPLSIGDEAEFTPGETHFFAMRLLDSKGLDSPRFFEPMTLTIRYTDDEVAGLDEDMLDIYYYDETDPDHPKWVSLGAVVDPEHNEITMEIRHFSKYAIGGKSKNRNSASLKP